MSFAHAYMQGEPLGALKNTVCVEVVLECAKAALGPADAKLLPVSSCSRWPGSRAAGRLALPARCLRAASCWSSCPGVAGRQGAHASPWRLGPPVPAHTGCNVPQAETRDRWQRAVWRELKRLGLDSFSYEGGEPLSACSAAEEAEVQVWPLGGGAGASLLGLQQHWRAGLFAARPPQ